ncbi:MAG: hypothetical protein WCC21_06300 [Candidatus Acidiferrales bacterium]
MRRFSKYEVLLVILFILSLPLSNPWVRGDGVGYYAFARSLLIEHRLDFTKDWQAANVSFRMARLGDDGNPKPVEYTATGHIDNHFSVGPAILWSPFLISTHVALLLYARFGGDIPADGFSRPYRIAMAVGTAIYGFLALAISFVLARKYVAERWAFLATLGIWFASSLPVYMYFNPSWSHAHSAFTVALFLWYWVRTRTERRLAQWLVLGLIGGLMLDVYYVDGIVLLFPLLESVVGYREVLKRRNGPAGGHLLVGNAVFGVGLVAAFLPTLITKRILYGSFTTMGYEHLWNWTSPALLKVCFSSDHGLFSWTPILVAAVAGLFFLWRHDRELATYSIAVFMAFVYVIGCYSAWNGLSSFGNRYFISLTPVFVLGLAGLFDCLERLWTVKTAEMVVASATALLALWNLGLVFQWGTHLISTRGPISWRDAAYNQIAVVPAEATQTMLNYLTRRRQMMDRIEEEDVRQLQHR